MFKGTWRGTEVAIKRIPANCIRDSDTRDFMKEAFILRQLRHPNVLQVGCSSSLCDYCFHSPSVEQVVCSFLTSFQVLGASMNPPCIVTEYMPRGSLFQLIHDSSVDLSWSMVRKISLDICKGMSYLHGCTPPLIHRDLKVSALFVRIVTRVAFLCFRG